ncbi:RdRP-domain-containing protein [Dentipellis sp. KUC8613]|nr:RdRP-domain-containing protein [Dentipellis sp. KUC8613]
MEFELRYVDRDASKYHVVKAIETVLHGPDLFDPADPKTKGRVPNFEVKLEPRPAGGVGNNGTGRLVVPSQSLGERLLRWLRDNPEKHAIRVLGRRIKIVPTRRKVPNGLRQTLEKALYVGPEKEKEHDEIVYELNKSLRVAKVQFGVWFKPNDAPQASRQFSIEYEADYTQKSVAWLDLKYDHKEIRVELGERMTEEQAFSVVVKFSSIRKMGIGFDFGNAFICFDLVTPPVLEETNFNNREREGFKRHRNKDRDRIPALDEAHARVSPYAHHLRIVLLNSDDIYDFERLCRTAKCEPMPIRVQTIEASSMGFYSHRQLHSVQRWLKTMDWTCAYQIEALLCNGLMNTHELLTVLKDPIDRMRKKFGTRANEVLRHFIIALRTLGPDDTPRKCFERVCADQEDAEPLRLSAGSFFCHHITITPTRMLLDGPNVTQSNRVIRRYQDHGAGEFFIRVEFKDEDRLQYRWDRDIDGTWFLQQRVGHILKHGFDLAGRRFEFLAYSSSALREHAVWFMCPFEDLHEGYVDSEHIRRSLGDFSGELLRQPSKLAARLAQAFTATDPSVVIMKGQWEEMLDLGIGGYIHPEDDVPTNDVCTDGVGTISLQLAMMIWDALCNARPGLRENSVMPSAYQIRFLGYKGVVVVDYRLEGVKMRLRPSMRKFRSHDVESAEIEIARAFERPNRSYLNRPLVTVLEDRGAEIKTFMDLQEKAKEAIYTAGDTLLNFRKLLRENGLGFGFHVPFILEQLAKLNLDFKSEGMTRAIDYPLLNELLRYAINAVLRDVKHRARIPLPDSYMLVGVADEGRAYILEGADPEDVFVLGEGEIAACIQERPDEEPKWLEGTVCISRSPVVHPGDVRRVWAIKPPDDKLCFFRDLKNVVVLPVAGNRSLASCLGGGDLDGDLFDIIAGHPQLVPNEQVEAGSYTGTGTLTLDRDCTVTDICDFIVEYIHSDVLGLLSDKHIIIADQSADHTSDWRCLRLAELCSHAVDYPKNGKPVDIDTPNALPRNLIPFKPDWHRPEDQMDDGHDADYYESDRALGHLYRNIKIRDLNAPLPTSAPPPPPPAEKPKPNGKKKNKGKGKDKDKGKGKGRPPTPEPDPAAPPDSISQALFPLIQRAFDEDSSSPEPDWAHSSPASLFTRYARELRCIRATHTLREEPGAMLAEAELAVGAILSACSNGRWRAARTFSMKTHVDVLVRNMRAAMMGEPVGGGGAGFGAGRGGADNEGVDKEVLCAGLKRAWDAWTWVLGHQELEGIRSFGLVALGVVLDCLKRLDLMPDPVAVPVLQ